MNGEVGRTVGVSNSAGSEVAGKNAVGVSSGSGVLVGRWVRDGRGLAVIEGNSTGPPVARTTGVGIAAQAASVSANPTQSNNFLIMTLDLYDR